jgi:hypothetical protein
MKKFGISEFQRKRERESWNLSIVSKSLRMISRA